MSSLVKGMASLLCSERTESPRGIEDPVLSDPRVGQNLLSLQTTTSLPFNYFLGHTNVLPFMRKMVAEWMMSVCYEQKCDETIYPLSMSYFDRFLCTTAVDKSQLQLVGAVSMLLATKMRQSRNFSPQLLSEYTEFSVSEAEILRWEVLMLARLGWDVSHPIANDFVDHVLVRSKIPLSKNSTVRRHAILLIYAIVTDHAGIMMKPSLIAAGALGYAARNLGFMFPSETMAGFIEDDALYVEQAIAYAGRLVQESKMEYESNEQATAAPVQPPPPSSSPVPEEYIPSIKVYSEGSDHYDGNETPTDVTDVEF